MGVWETRGRNPLVYEAEADSKDVGAECTCGVHRVPVKRTCRGAGGTRVCYLIMISIAASYGDPDINVRRKLKHRKHLPDSD